LVGFFSCELWLVPDCTGFEARNSDNNHDKYPNEQRLATLGMRLMRRLLVVVYTWQGENIPTSHDPARNVEQLSNC
jgi:hypothetical protein